MGELPDDIRAALAVLALHRTSPVVAGQILADGRDEMLISRTLAERPSHGWDATQPLLKPTDTGMIYAKAMLDGHDLWSCLVGTEWSVIPTSHKGALQRAWSTLAAGGRLRPATATEVATWKELERLRLELAGAKTAGERLAILAEDTLDAVQLGLL